MTKPEPTSEGPVFDIAILEHEMRREDAYLRGGHTARTLERGTGGSDRTAGVPGDELEFIPLPIK